MRGLYAITSDDFISSDTLLDDVAHALAGGAAVIQYRDKKSSLAVREEAAAALTALCHEQGAMLIINDDVELAKKVNADGVHLGKTDMTLEYAREYLGMRKVIGVSCYNDIKLAQLAVIGGADYVAFGRFYSSRTKPQAVEVSIDILKDARRQIAVPIVAIGGITAQNGVPLIDAGADMLAVIDGVFGQQDITRAASEIAALF